MPDHPPLTPADRARLYTEAESALASRGLLGVVDLLERLFDHDEAVTQERDALRAALADVLACEAWTRGHGGMCRRMEFDGTRAECSRPCTWTSDPYSRARRLLEGK